MISPRSRSIIAGDVAATALLLILALFVIVPWQGALDRIGDAANIPPVPTAKGYTEQALAILNSGAWWRVEPDYSLFLVRNVEFATRNAARWHIVTAYGPWSFLFRGYHPANYVPLVVAWSSFALITALLLRRTPIIGFALLVVLAANPRPTLLLVLPLLVFRSYFETRRFGPLIALGSVALALMGFVKSSSLILGLIVVVAMAIDQMLLRRAPYGLAVYVASFLAFWFLAGQDVGWLLPFLRGTWHVSSTYGEAEFSGAMTVSTVLLLLTAVCIVALQVARLRRGSDFLGVVTLVAILLAFVKTALVRSDIFHAELAPAAMMALVLVFAGDLARRRAIVAVIVVASIAVISPFLPPIDELRRQFVAIADPLAAKRRSDALYARDLASTARQTPLPQIGGTVDVYGDRQSIALAHGLDYQPRPVYQSYIAYDQYLATANARYLRSNQAPDFILFSMSRSDERFPSLDDGLSWPELLTRYRLSGVSPEFALLQRASPASAYQLRPCGTIRARMGARFRMPDQCSGLVWTRMQIQPTIGGRLLAILYRAPEIDLFTTTGDRETIGGRLIRRTAAAGFLLSPVIVGPIDFAALASGRADTLAPRVVDSLVIESKTGAHFYQPEITITLYQLVLHVR